MSTTKAARREAQDVQRARKVAATMTVKATQLVLVRHGETDWNREHRLQGQLQPGPPLNEQGWKQCSTLAQVLQQRYNHFDAIVSSDLLRTYQTAQLLAAPYKLQVQQHTGLRERNLGLLQGCTYADAPTAQPDAWAALRSSSSSVRLPGGGESLDDLRERVAATLLDIAARHPGQRVLCVSHGGAIHAAHRAARGYMAKEKVFNCGITVVMADADRVQQQPGMQCTAQQQQQQQNPDQQQHNPAQKQQQSPDQKQQQNPFQQEQQDAGQRQQQQQQRHEQLVEQQQQQQRPLLNSTNSTCTLQDGSTKCMQSCSIQLHVDCRSSTTNAEGSFSSSNSSMANTAGICSNCSSSSNGNNSSSSGCGCEASAKFVQQAVNGRLAMMVWNDAHELVTQGLVDEAGFGGSSREA